MEGGLVHLSSRESLPGTTIRSEIWKGVPGSGKVQNTALTSGPSMLSPAIEDQQNGRCYAIKNSNKINCRPAEINNNQDQQILKAP